jgi:hypothetical protein
MKDDKLVRGSAIRSIFFRVLDHDLNCRCGPADEGAIDPSEWHVFPCELGEYRAIRERKRSVPVLRHRNDVTENAPEFVQTRFMRDGDQLPLAVAGARPAVNGIEAMSQAAATAASARMDICFMERLFI